MNSRNTITVFFCLGLVALGVAMGKLIFFRPNRLVAYPREQVPDVIYIPKRFLRVVADYDGFYCGQRKLTHGTEGVYVATFARQNRLDYLLLAPTESSNYGKVVEFLGSLDRKVFRDFTVVTVVVKTGTRMEPIGRNDWVKDE